MPVKEKKKKKRLKKAGEIFLEDIQGDVCVIVSSTKVIHHVDCHIAAKMTGKEMLIDEARKSGCRLSRVRGGCCRGRFGDHLISECM